MTDKEIIDTMRNWFGDPDVADCVFESEQSLKDWLDRGARFAKEHKPEKMINAEYVMLYNADGQPLSSELMIFNKETMMIYRIVCTAEYLEASDWKMERRTP